MSDESNNPKWVEIQKKTFTRWANTFLKERLMKMEDLSSDFGDGVLLINLLEIISSKELGKYNTKPKMRAHKLENTSLALKFLQKEGIKLVNIGNEDIVNGNLKLILGLVWTIILRYQIHIEEGKSARSDLLKWVRQQIPEYDIQNFTKDWNDGKAICALANSLKPGLCPNHRELNPNHALANAETGIDLAWKELEIPKVLDARDMVDPEVDELSVMTYISYYRDWLANQSSRKKQEEIERTAVPARCRAYGPGFERGETQITTNFTIEAINANGRRVPQGGDPFVVNIRGPGGNVPNQLTDNNDGTYNVVYTPSDAGKHIITVTLHDKHISNSPKEIPVTRSGADALNCKAFGPGLEAAVVGETAPFTIQAFNRLGQPVKDGGDPFEVRIQAPFNSTVAAKIVDNNNGSYSVTYVPIDVGTHVVSITLQGTPVAKSPYRVPVTRPLTAADPNFCVAYGPGLEKGFTGEPAQFTVEVRNSRGERLRTGGHPVDVDISDARGVEVPARIVDNRDGTYAVTYEPKEAGVHTVDVVIRNKFLPLYYDHIKDSPFKVKIDAGADAGQSIAFGPGLQDGIPDTLPTHFTIQAKDRDGNNMKRGGDPFEVRIQGPRGPVDSKLTDNGDGTYTVDYQPGGPGKHKIDVTLKDVPIKGAPFTVLVREGADESQSFIENYTFTIRARTKQGNNRKDGGDDFKVDIQGPGGAVPGVTLKDVGDGTYFCSYKLPSSGDYTVNVKLNGKHIKGSPWRQHI